MGLMKSVRTRMQTATIARLSDEDLKCVRELLRRQGYDSKKGRLQAALSEIVEPEVEVFDAPAQA